MHAWWLLRIDAHAYRPLFAVICAHVHRWIYRCDALKTADGNTHTETPTICLERVLLCVKKHFNRSYIENAKPYLLPHAYVYVKHSNMLIIRCLMNAYTAFGQYMKKKESSSALRQLIFCHNTSSHRTDFHPLDEACLWLYCGGGCRWCCNCGCDVHGR